MMRLWPLITDLIARLIARLIAVNGKIAITSHRHAAPHLHVTSGRARACARAPPVRPPAPRRASPRLGLGLGHGHGHGHGPARPGSARRASARARVVHRPPLTGFTSGVQEVHLLSRLRSSSIPGTELNIDSLALIVGFKFF